MSNQKNKNRRFEPAQPTPAAPASPAWQQWLAAACLIAAGLLAYAGSFRGVFLFDDNFDIVRNPTVHKLWPPLESFLAPHNLARPVAALTLAINYAISGLEPWSYHAFNLGVHLLAGLTLFGIVRRTLLSERLRERFGAISTPAAAAVALLWLLHPLQTGAVTYVIQRFESLMGLFYLLTLYCVIRAHSSARSGLWRGAAVAACALGMGCKQVMITAPLLALLYDATFLSGSWRAVLRRWKLHAALALTMLIVVATQAASPKLTFAGFDFAPVSPWEYARSQPGVILHYLRLAFWPDALCLDYGWPVTRNWSAILPGALTVGALLAATAWALVRAPARGFCGAWFFLILAPTSSVMPIADLAFEHRMYLPLAALIAAAALSIADCGLRIVDYWRARSNSIRNPQSTILNCLVAVTLLLALALGLRTARRNADYEGEWKMWNDVAAQRPANARAHYNLGVALEKENKPDEARREYEAALALKPDYSEAHNNFGILLARRGNDPEAIKHYETALKLNPNFPEAHNSLGNAYSRAGKEAEAMAQFREALRLKPDFAGPHVNLGNALSARGKLDEAIEHFAAALRSQPAMPEAHYSLGCALEKQGKRDEAVAEFREALRLRPKFPEAEARLKIYERGQ